MYDDGGGHCWACGHHVWPKHYISVIHKEEKHDTALLPSDFSREIPAEAWKWLLQYGLPISYWKPFVGYSEKDSRLVFTVGDPTAFAIGRYIGNGDEGKEKRKWFVWGDSHKSAVSYGSPDNGTKVVIVEDIVSAHKVGQVEIGIPVFGTVIHPCHYRLLKYFGLPIVLWLDEDQGPYIRKKAAQIGMVTGLPVEIISTKKDPKSIELEKIKELLNE